MSIEWFLTLCITAELYSCCVLNVRASERANECTYVRVGGIECHMWTHSKLNWWILLFLTEQLEANSYGFEKKRRNTLNNLNWTCLLAGHPYRLIYLAGGLPSHFHPYISRSKFMWTGGRTDIRRWLSLTIIKPFLSTLFINTLQKQLFVPGFLLSTFIPSLRLSSLLFLGCSFFPSTQHQRRCLRHSWHCNVGEWWVWKRRRVAMRRSTFLFHFSFRFSFSVFFSTESCPSSVN